MIRDQNICTCVSKGRLNGRKSRDRLRRDWGDDIVDWTEKTVVGRAEEKCCVNPRSLTFRNEDETGQ